MSKELTPDLQVLIDILLSEERAKLTKIHTSPLSNYIPYGAQMAERARQEMVTRRRYTEMINKLGELENEDQSNR